MAEQPPSMDQGNIRLELEHYEADRSAGWICRVTQTLGGRTDVRLAQSLPLAQQRLQPKPRVKRSNGLHLHDRPHFPTPDGGEMNLTARSEDGWTGLLVDFVEAPSVH